jgi:Arc/MetJ family transcription regulator
MSIKTKRVTVYFEVETHKVLKLAAVESARSVSDIVNMAVQMLLSHEGIADSPEIPRVGESGKQFAASRQTLDIDDGLLRAAMLAGGHKTRKAAVTRALADYITRLQQMKVLELLGKIDIDPDYDYKAQRRRK